MTSSPDDRSVGSGIIWYTVQWTLSETTAEGGNFLGGYPITTSGQLLGQSLDDIVAVEVGVGRICTGIT